VAWLLKGRKSLSWPGRPAAADGAVGATQPRVCHTLLSSPGTRNHDLGAVYYDERAQTRRKIRYHLAEVDAPATTSPLPPGPARTTTAREPHRSAAA